MIGIFKRKCKHEIPLDTIEQTFIEPLKVPNSNDYFEWQEYFREIYLHPSHTHRIQGKCRKCNKTLYAHCGLMLDGKIVR